MRFPALKFAAVFLTALTASHAYAARRTTSSSRAPAAGHVQETAEARVLPLRLVQVGKGSTVRVASAFAIGRDGIMITSYQAVSEALFEPDAYRVEIDLSARQIEPARVVYFDLTADLAILRIKHAFDSFYEVSSRDFRKNEGAFVISRSEGRLVVRETHLQGRRQAGPVAHLLLTAPPGGSALGGPIVDSRNQVVGIAQTMSSPSSATLLATPRNEILPAIVEARPMADGMPVNAALAVAQNQAKTRLVKWMLDWKRQQASVRPLPFLGFSLAAPPPGASCELHKERIISLNCHTLDYVKFLPGRASGWLSLGFAPVPPMTSIPMDDEMDESLLISELKAAAGEKTAPPKPGRALASADASSFSCTKLKVHNRHRLISNVRYCLRETPSAPGFYDFVLTDTPTLGGRSMVAELTLLGFSRVSVNAAAMLFVDGIGKADP